MEIDAYLAVLAAELPCYRKEEILLELRCHLDDAVRELSREHPPAEAALLALERFGYQDYPGQLASEFRTVYEKEEAYSLLQEGLFSVITVLFIVISFYLFDHRLLLFFDLPSLLLLVGGVLLATLINDSRQELQLLWKNAFFAGRKAARASRAEILNGIKLLSSMQGYTIQVGWLVGVVRLIFLISSFQERIWEEPTALIPTLIPIFYAYICSLFGFNLLIKRLQGRIDGLDRKP